jgi:hypothetical protein
MSSTATTVGCVRQYEIWQTYAVKRVVLLALAAAAFMWVGALLDFGRRSRETPAATGTELAAQPSGAPEPGPPPPRVAGPRERKPSGLFGKLTQRLSRGATAPAVQEPAPPPPKEETQGELGTASRSPAYAKLERNYAAEPRNDEWANAQEHRIRGLLQSAALYKKVALINCQDTVCRIVLDGVTPSAFDEILRVPGLREETKLDPQSPYSLRGGQLTLYFAPGAPTLFSTPP